MCHSGLRCEAYPSQSAEWSCNRRKSRGYFSSHPTLTSQNKPPPSGAGRLPNGMCIQYSFNGERLYTICDTCQVKKCKADLLKTAVMGWYMLRNWFLPGRKSMVP